MKSNLILCVVRTPSYWTEFCKKKSVTSTLPFYVGLPDSTINSFLYKFLCYYLYRNFTIFCKRSHIWHQLWHITKLQSTCVIFPLHESILPSLCRLYYRLLYTRYTPVIRGVNMVWNLAAHGGPGSGHRNFLSHPKNISDFKLPIFRKQFWFSRKKFSQEIKIHLQLLSGEI